MFPELFGANIRNFRRSPPDPSHLLPPTNTHPNCGVCVLWWWWWWLCVCVYMVWLKLIFSFTYLSNGLEVTDCHPSKTFALQ